MEALLGDREIRNKTTKVSGTGEENIFCCLLDLDDLSVEYFLVNLELRSGASRGVKKSQVKGR